MYSRINKSSSGSVAIKWALLQDRNLSCKARGVISYLLSRGESWRSNISEMKTEKDAESSTQSAFKELVEQGYAKFVKIYSYDKKKLVGSFYDIFEDKEDCRLCPNIMYIKDGEEFYDLDKENIIKTSY